MIDENGDNPGAIVAGIVIGLVILAGGATMLQPTDTSGETSSNIGLDIEQIAIDVTSAVGKSIKRQAKKLQNKYVNKYWEADIDNGRLNVNKDAPLTFNQAVSRINNRQSVMSKNILYAEALAIATNKNRELLNKIEKHNGKLNEEYFWHFHPFQPHQNTHIWFYIGPVPVNLD